jgi:TrmH family RNA methyltransferase
VTPVEVLAVPDAEVREIPGCEIVRVAPALLSPIGSLGHPARLIALFEGAALPRVAVGTVTVQLGSVRDAGNIGTILRTLAALGPGSLVLGPGSADPLSHRAVRASMGALFSVPIVDAAPPGLRVALDARAETELDAVDLRGPVTFLLGAERSGLSDQLRATADVACRIPQEAAADSINVAMAATIALYETRRQRAAAAR